jgi:uncharacterized damage-inducible protein DinB
MNKLPDTYAAIDANELISVYALGPERLNHVLQDLSIFDLDATPKPGKWSIRQITVHLTDAEIVGSARIRKVYAESGSQLPVYEQDFWASAFQYHLYDSKEFYSAVMLFDALRLCNTKIFQKAGGDDWRKFGLHPEMGPLTFRQILELYADHSERHIGQILALRQLIGKKIDYPLLLEKRLY